MPSRRQKLHIGFQNINYVEGKLSDVNVYLNKQPTVHIFGIAETRFTPSVSDASIAIPNYTVFRRDRTIFGTVGLAVYVHDTIRSLVRRREDLETQDVESLCLEVKDGHTAPLFISFMYRNGRVIKDTWYSNFKQMARKLCQNKPNVMILGDFNIDMTKSHVDWTTIHTVLGLKQLVQSPTRITHKTASLLDHIYSNNPEKVSDVNVGNLSVSDHSPITCYWSMQSQLPKKNCHTFVSYRSFKHFHKENFLMDLKEVSFISVYQESDPNNALAVWYSLFLPILDKHAPLKRKRIKSKKPPEWLTPEIIQAMENRDKLKKDKKFDEFEQNRKFQI